MSVTIAMDEHAMHQRLIDGRMYRLRVGEAARAIIAANKAARVWTHETMTPEEVLCSILLVMADLSLGLPDDWCAWVKRELRRALDEQQLRERGQTRLLERQLASYRAKGLALPLGKHSSDDEAQPDEDDETTPPAA